MISSHSKPLRNCHVRQRDANDCVIATVAAVVNMPHDMVAAFSPRIPEVNGIYPHETRQILQKATNIRWKYPRTLYFRRLRTLCSSNATLILFIRQPGSAFLQRVTRKMQHCVFVRNDLVYDPELNDVVHADNYSRIDWIPTIAYYPVDSSKLQELQIRNYSLYRKERMWSAMIGC